MKAEVARILAEAIDALPELREAVGSLSIESTLERTRDASHGDFASNSPRDLAAAIIEKLPDTDRLDRVEIAGPGFINFHLSAAAFNAELVRVLDQGEEYGRRAPRAEPRILLEFVSANPTGPLHVGHGRHAAYGASVGNLLEALGYPVHREYYVNDAGRQMDRPECLAALAGVTGNEDRVSIRRLSR
jgi:arginyl-tRNA synthetase